MYLIDFFKCLVKKNNIGLIIWLVMNSILVTFILAAVFISLDLPQWLCYVLGFLSYIGSLAVALSPVGEFLLRIQQGCKKVTDPEVLARLEPLFKEVHERSAKITPNMNRNVRFYLSDDEDPNAFATGRNTVCVTRGLLMLSDAEIKAVLAHEFGHLAHKDTDGILVVAVGNFIVSGIFLIYRLIFTVIAWIFRLVGFLSESAGSAIIGVITKIFVDVILGAAMWCWTKLGVLLCMHTSRKNEFLADKYAYRLGYRAQLCSALIHLSGDGDGSSTKSNGLWASLNASHPDTPSRVEALKSYPPLGKRTNGNNTAIPPVQATDSLMM